MLFKATSPENLKVKPMAANPMSKDTVAWIGPASNAVAVTPHDTNALAVVTRGIIANGAGNIACRFAGASADTTIAVTASTVYPFSLSHIRSTSTTATGIFALY